jgi:hypothetical protein
METAPTCSIYIWNLTNLELAGYSWTDFVDASLRLPGLAVAGTDAVG